MEGKGFLVMKTKRAAKGLALALLLGLCLWMTGCYIPPDQITDDTQDLTVGSSNLPFQTLAPTATASPTATPAQNTQSTAGVNVGDVTGSAQPTVTVDWNAGWGPTDSGAATTPPSSNATVAVVTSAPTNTPKPTATPAPTEAPTPEPTAAPSETEVPPFTDDDYTTGSITVQEENAFLLLNQDRAANGRSALELDPALCDLARLKSRDMYLNNYFSHTSPTYGSAAQMLSAYGYAFTSVGENIAHHATVEKAQAAFMSSSGHRQNILGSQWTKVGIGVWEDSQGFVYVTQLFVR